MTNRRVHIKRRLILPVFVSAVICAMILLSMSIRMPTVSADSSSQILLSPTSATLAVGETFTMTVNLTNFPNLDLYQVVFKYNGTVLNLTNVWFPTNYVFSGQNAQSAWSSDTGVAGDVVDHLNYTVAGSSLIGTGNVSVSNGLLCEANFTAIAMGQSTIEIATKDAPAHGPSGGNWYTFCEDPTATEYDTFVTNTSTIAVPEFSTILLLIMLPLLGIAVLITRKKLARRAW
jgi:hypothetical protein